MDLHNLIKFIVARKERLESKELKYNTADAPHIHLIGVVAICHKTLRSSVPSGGNIFSARLRRINTSARAKVSQLNRVFPEQDVLRLYVSVVNSIPVHMLDGFNKLVHLILDTAFG